MKTPMGCGGNVLLQPDLEHRGDVGEHRRAETAGPPSKPPELVNARAGKYGSRFALRL